jgi:hypothetical protein
MTKIITAGNLAIVEYPTGANEPEFTFEKDGVLWIYGYSLTMLGQSYTMCKKN